MKREFGIKSICLYGMGLLAEKVVSFLMLPVITRILLPEEYGTLEILTTFLNTLSIILGCGLTDAVFRFGGMAKTPQLLNKICSSAMALAFLIALVICVPVILFAHIIASAFPGHTTSLQIVYTGLILIITNVSGIQLDWMRLKNDVRAFVLINVQRAILQACLVFMTLYMGYGVTGIMFSGVISNLFLLLHVFYGQPEKKFQLNSKWQKKMFFYGLPLSVNGIAESILAGLPVWWLPHVIGMSGMAIFALSMKFAVMVLLLISPFTMWWLPERYKHIGTKSGRKYCAESAETCVTLCLLFALFTTYAGSVFILWLTPSVYHEAVIYLPWLSFILALKQGANMMNAGLFLSHTSYPMWINTLLTLFVMVAFYFVIPHWQAWGVIVVLIVAFLVRWMLYVYLSQKALFLPYQYTKLGVFFMVVFMGTGCAHWMSDQWDYIIKGGFLCVMTTVCAFATGLLPSFSYKSVRYSE